MGVSLGGGLIGLKKFAEFVKSVHQFLVLLLRPPDVPAAIYESLANVIKNIPITSAMPIELWPPPFLIG